MDGGTLAPRQDLPRLFAGVQPFDAERDSACPVITYGQGAMTTTSPIAEDYGGLVEVMPTPERLFPGGEAKIVINPNKGISAEADARLELELVLFYGTLESNICVDTRKFIATGGLQLPRPDIPTPRFNFRYYYTDGRVEFERATFGPYTCQDKPDDMLVGLSVCLRLFSREWDVGRLNLLPMSAQNAWHGIGVSCSDRRVQASPPIFVFNRVAAFTNATFLLYHPLDYKSSEAYKCKMLNFPAEGLWAEYRYPNLKIDTGFSFDLNVGAKNSAGQIVRITANFSVAALVGFPANQSPLAVIDMLVSKAPLSHMGSAELLVAVNKEEISATTTTNPYYANMLYDQTLEGGHDSQLSRFRVGVNKIDLALWNPLTREITQEEAQEVSVWGPKEIVATHSGILAVLLELDREIAIRAHEYLTKIVGTNTETIDIHVRRRRAGNDSPSTTTTTTTSSLLSCGSGWMELETKCADTMYTLGVPELKDSIFNSSHRTFLALLPASPDQPGVLEVQIRRSINHNLMYKADVSYQYG
eukprot:UC1_evm1s1904